MQKRVDFFGPSRPSEMDIGQLWLGQFVPTYPCPSLERMGNLGDGGKVGGINLLETGNFREHDHS